MWLPKKRPPSIADILGIAKPDPNPVPEWGIPPDPETVYRSGPYYLNRAVRRYTARANRETGPGYTRVMRKGRATHE